MMYRSKPTAEFYFCPKCKRLHSHDVYLNGWHIITICVFPPIFLVYLIWGLIFGMYKCDGCGQLHGGRY